MLNQFSKLLVHLLAAFLELDRLLIIKSSLVPLLHGQERVLVALNDKLKRLDDMLPNL